jgi:AcrR family transcriptional regulator
MIQSVSVRRILSEAGINPALAHYHFGSRAKLVEAVLRRRLIPMNEERLALLDEVEAQQGADKPTLEDVLRAYLAPAVRLINEHPEFARLVAYLYVVRDESLRAFEADPVDAEVTKRLGRAARDALPPHISDLELLCRARFVTGVLLHTMAAFREPLLAEYGGGVRLDELSTEQLLEEMVAFCAAGLRARPSESSPVGGAE